MKMKDQIKNKMIEIGSLAQTFFMTNNLDNFILEEDFSYFDRIELLLEESRELFSKIIEEGEKNETN